MKRKLIQLFVLLTILMVFLPGCPMSFTSLDDDSSAFSDSGDDNGENTGDETFTGIKLTMPRYAPWLGAAISASSGSKAFAFNDEVEITVKDSVDDVIFNDTFTPEFTGSQEISCNVVLVPGTGYSAEVKIYNHEVSTTEPVVTGTSAADFDITEGNSTQVPIYCLPSNPTPALADTLYDLTMVPMLLGTSPMTTGYETWYSIVFPDSGFMELSFTVPGDVVAFYSIFDQTGASTYSYNTSQNPGPYCSTVEGTPGDTYYMVVIFAHETVPTPVSGSVIWTEVSPQVLSDSEVPDPWLRDVLEDKVGGGKEFADADHPTPANQITDMDLNLLSDTLEFSISGHSERLEITTLKGLEYCDNIRKIYFQASDLSSCDQTAGSVDALALEGMDSLDTLSVSYCDLTSFDFISGLSGLEDLGLSGNTGIDIDTLDILTTANFPNMEYLQISGWDVDGDTDWDSDDYFDETAWGDIQALLQPFSNLKCLELSGFYMGDTLLADLYEEDEVLDSNMSTLVELTLDNCALSNTSVENVLSDFSNLRWLRINGNPLITDISSLGSLQVVGWLDLAGTGITDLSVLQAMRSDGAFTDTYDWTPEEININNCSLELWPGSPNRIIVDDLISDGVRVSYTEGNQLTDSLLTDSEVDVTLDMDYTGSLTISESDYWISVYLTYSDTMAPFAYGEVYSNNGSITFDKPLIPLGDEVKAIAWIDADHSFNLTAGDRYVEYTTPITADGGSAVLSFDDSDTYTGNLIDVQGGWLIVDDTWGRIELYITGDAISFVRENPSSYEDAADVNNYGTIVSFVNNASDGYLVYQMDYHPNTPFIGQYAKLTWADHDGWLLEEIYYAYTTEAEAIAATEGGYAFSNVSGN